MGLLKKIFGDYSSREIKRITPIKDKVLALDEEYSKLTDEELKAKTPYFKERLANGETISCPRHSPPAARLRGVCSG
jgi:preprotein translocase subunit SecA